MEEQETSHHAFLVDPNQNQNRIPPTTPLFMAKGELKRAKDAHECTQARHDHLLRVLEIFQSQLGISQSYLVTEEHRLAVLHPIHQCPEDILKLIFECVAHDDGRRLLKAATTLSHVCRGWHAIAVSIPSLWTQIDVSMDTDDIKDLRSFMERTKKRVKITPVNVTIRDVAFRTNFMECMDLQHFTTITTLEYRLVSSKNILLLLGPPFNQTANVKQLIVAAPRKYADLPAWDIAKLLGSYPVLESIRLDGVGVVAFEGVTTLPSLRRLRILNTKALDLLQFLAQHSQLQELVIQGKNLYCMEELMQDIALPALRRMTITFVNGFPWDRISTPLLQTIETEDDRDSAKAFICRHPSILYLLYFPPINELEFKDMAKSLANVENLFISGFIDGLFKIDPDIPFPPFPKLINLTLDQRSSPHISLENFEQLLSIRCLLQEPSNTNNIQRISSLSIWLLTKKLDSAPWRQSALLSHFRLTVKEWGANCTVRLKIPNGRV